jgi:hypothetical protein
LGLATFVIDRAGDFGLLSGLDTECRAWFDALASLSVVLEHPYSLTLLDARAEVLDDGGHRLAELHAALVVHTGGENSDIESRIQHLLNAYTNSAESTLESTMTWRGPMYTLRDRRLPQWVVLRWGPIGDKYVVTIGEGAFTRVEAVQSNQGLSLASDAWLEKAFKAAGGSSAAAVAYATPTRLYAGADAQFAEKIDRVREAILAKDIEKGLWTFAFAGRAVEAKGFLRRDGVDELRPVTTDRIGGVPESQVIPETATGYAVLDIEPQKLCDSVCEAYLAARSPGTRQELRAYWRDLQRKAEVSIAGDIMVHLGRGVAIHNSPRHALRLPLAWTIVMPVVGDVGDLRKNIDRIAGVWRDQLAEVGTVGLRQSPDGIWYLYFGINGPAVGVTDRWLVASFSPDAVRKNLAHLESAGRPIADGPAAVSD